MGGGWCDVDPLNGTWIDTVIDRVPIHAVGESKHDRGINAKSDIFLFDGAKVGLQRVETEQGSAWRWVSRQVWMTIASTNIVGKRNPIKVTVSG